jgi:hypothetical protein
MPRVEMEDNDLNDDIIGTMDFAVTRDFSILHDNARTNMLDRKSGHSPKVKRKLNISDETTETSDANLHEMDL